MLLQPHGETEGVKSCPATTQCQRHYLKLFPFTLTLMAHAIKHKKDLGFLETEASFRFHAWKSNNLQI